MRGTPRPWLMLATGVVAQLSSSIAVNGPAFLIPVLHQRRGLSLAEAGTVAAAPLAGTMLTLMVWGFAVDRYGERTILLTGLAGTTAAGALAAVVHGTVSLGLALLVAGGFAASTAAASGRLVVGWFPAHRRGLAMGIRQMAQPLGVGVGAISIAVIADRAGIRTALLVPVIATALALLAVWASVVDPPRPERTARSSASPYRSDFLWRIHGVSVLLVLPQFAVWTFGLVWLIDAHGWSPAAAGALVAASQIAGAVGRIAIGHVSDLVGSRTRPLFWVAVAAGVCMLALAATDWLDWWVAVPMLVVATTVTVADNGLAFTSVAEFAGPFWSGRALGLQNTSQYLTAAACAPTLGAAITAWGYPAAFALTAIGPLVALPLVPHLPRESAER